MNYLTIEEIRQLVAVNGILDGTKGGLIIGNAHDSYGIKLIRESNENKYEIIGEVEGWEYLMNPTSSIKYKEEIEKINNELAKSNSIFEEYSVPGHIDIINAVPIIKGFNITSRLILMGEYAQFVVNKYSTKKYLEQLDIYSKN